MSWDRTSSHGGFGVPPRSPMARPSSYKKPSCIFNQMDSAVTSIGKEVLVVVMLAARTLGRMDVMVRRLEDSRRKRFFLSFLCESEAGA